MTKTGNHRSDKRLGLAQIHLAALLAGFTGLFAKLPGAGPVAIVAGRTAVAFVALAIIARLTGVGFRLRERGDWRFAVISGVFLAAHWLTFFQAIRISSVAVGLLAFSSYPLFVTLLEPVVFREKPRLHDLAAVPVVLAGLCLLAPTGFSPGDRTTQGLLWGVLSGARSAPVFR